MVQRLKQAAKKLAEPEQDVMAAMATNPAASGRKAVSAAPARKRAPAAVPHGKSLEQERDALKAALAVAEARIHALEESQTQVVNRIGWMVEALQTLKDESR